MNEDLEKLIKELKRGAKFRENKIIELQKEIEELSNGKKTLEAFIESYEKEE